VGVPDRTAPRADIVWDGGKLCAIETRTKGQGKGWIIPTFQEDTLFLGESHQLWESIRRIMTLEANLELHMASEDLLSADLTWLS
jgi:hypothetical protein